MDIKGLKDKYDWTRNFISAFDLEGDVYNIDIRKKEVKLQGYATDSFMRAIRSISSGLGLAFDIEDGFMVLEFETTLGFSARLVATEKSK